jgi:hypothetical protein
MSGEVTKEEATGFGLNKTSQHNTVQTSDSLDFGFTPPVAKEIGGDIVVTAPRWVDWGKRFHRPPRPPKKGHLSSTKILSDLAVRLRRLEPFMAQSSAFYARKLPKN